MMRSDADMKMMIELEFSGSFLGLALKILPTVAMTTISLTQDSTMLLTPLKNNEFQVHFFELTVHIQICFNDKQQSFTFILAFTFIT